MNVSLKNFRVGMTGMFNYPLCLPYDARIITSPTAIARMGAKPNWDGPLRRFARRPAKSAHRGISPGIWWGAWVANAHDAHDHTFCISPPWGRAFWLLDGADVR